MLFLIDYRLTENCVCYKSVPYLMQSVILSQQIKALWWKKYIKNTLPKTWKKGPHTIDYIELLGKDTENWWWAQLSECGWIMKTIFIINISTFSLFSTVPANRIYSIWSQHRRTKLLFCILCYSKHNDAWCWNTHCNADCQVKRIGDHHVHNIIIYFCAQIKNQTHSSIMTMIHLE